MTNAYEVYDADRNLIGSLPGPPLTLPAGLLWIKPIADTREDEKRRLAAAWAAGYRAAEDGKQMNNPYVNIG